MKNFYFTTLLLFTFLSTNVFGETLERKTKNDDFSSLLISFEGFLGQDEQGVRLKADFKIIEKNGDYFGHSNTNLYCGTDKVPLWETKLSTSMLSKIRSFLSELEESPKSVYRAGYNNDSYKASYLGKDWDIKPDQNILEDIKAFSDQSGAAPNLGFYKTIFRKQIKNYFKEDKKHIARTDKLIQRKWHFDATTFSGLKRGSKIHLYASPNSKRIDFWEIDSDFGFTRNEALPSDSIARVNVEYNKQENIAAYMYLSIYAMDLLKVSDKEVWSFQHTSFYILELSEKELVLQIVY